MDWREKALCKGLLELFFSTDFRQINEAKSICYECPVREECLFAALEEEPPDYRSMHGVRGGMTARQRYRYRKEIAKEVKKWPRSVSNH